MNEFDRHEVVRGLVYHVADAQSRMRVLYLLKHEFECHKRYVGDFLEKIDSNATALVYAVDEAEIRDHVEEIKRKRVTLVLETPEPPETVDVDFFVRARENGDVVVVNRAGKGFVWE